MKLHNTIKPVSILILIVALAVLSGCGSRFTDSDVLRVAIVSGGQEFKLGASSAIVVRENTRNRRVFRGNPADQIVVKNDPKGIRFGGRLHKTDGLSIISNTPGAISINGTHYRGCFKVLKQEGALWVINYVKVEDYVKSVVACEMSPSWDIDALKAQAIVARSYAIFLAIKKPDALYYLSVNSQAYGGFDKEDPRSTKAVDSTRGKVIYYQGKLLQSFCHAACGGYTESPGNVWASEYEFPTPVRCKYCEGSKYSRWIARITFRDLQKRLRPLGIRDIYAIKPYKKSKYGGRITALKIIHDGGNQIVKFNRFRQLIGYSVIRSGFFKMRKDNGFIIFEGKGWGHGCGLCQEGARKLAEKGKSWKKILKFYFPKTKVKSYRF